MNDSKTDVHFHPFYYPSTFSQEKNHLSELVISDRVVVGFSFGEWGL